MEYPGNLLVIVAPSGAGKSSLIRGLLQTDEGLKLSVSYTTRSVRGEEEPGKDYIFVDKGEFEELIDTGELLEWARVHGSLYGTSKKWIEDQVTQGADVLLEIDWQGAMQIRNHFSNAVLIFILPPSLEELARRLRLRDEDSGQDIERRLLGAREELANAHRFDFTIVNNDYNSALKDLRCVVHSQRLRFSAQIRRNAEVFESLSLIN